MGLRRWRGRGRGARIYFGGGGIVDTHPSRQYHGTMISMGKKADAFYFRIPRDEVEAEEAERLLPWPRLEAGAGVKDVAYVALALHLDALLWTEDAVLKDGLRKRGFDRFFGG